MDRETCRGEAPTSRPSSPKSDESSMPSSPSPLRALSQDNGRQLPGISEENGAALAVGQSEDGLGDKNLGCLVEYDPVENRGKGPRPAVEKPIKPKGGGTQHEVTATGDLLGTVEGPDLHWTPSRRFLARSRPGGLIPPSTGPISTTGPKSP